MINICKGEQTNPDVFNFNREIGADAKMVVTKYNSGGEFRPGTVQYCFNYFDKFGQETNIVDVSPACTQILVESCDYLGIEISKDAMTCFLAGLITDTGGFKNSGITIESFEIAGRALSMGINLPVIYKESMLTISRERFEAQKVAMDRMEFFADGRISFTYINNEDTKKLNLKDGDHEGIVEIGRNVKNVEVSIFLHEEEKGYKISMRSNEYVNVAEICMTFGGGGHIKAAGASTSMSLEEAKKMLVREVEKRLK